MGTATISVRQRNKQNQSFECPWCHNQLPCTNTKKVLCVHCNVLIQPKGFNNKGQQTFIIGGIKS